MFDILTRTDVPVRDGHLATWSSHKPGRPLVFLHGGGLDHRMWREQVATFGDDQHVLLVDARGHGESSTATAAYRHCDDVAAVFRELALEPGVVVGLSMGGGTAVDLALEQPELVTGLVVSGVGTSEPVFTDPWVLDVFAEWQTAQEARDGQGWMDALLRFVSGPQRHLDEVDQTGTR